MSSLDDRKERGRNGRATQGQLRKANHLFGAPLASRVLGVARLRVYLNPAFVSCRN